MLLPICVTSTPEGYCTTARWEHGKVVFEIASEIPKLQLCTFSIDDSAGILIPQAGVRWNSSDYKISTNAASGPVKPLPITTTAPVGSFNKTVKVLFDAPRAGLPVTMHIGFTTMMAIKEGEEIRLRMAGFSGPPFSLNSSTSAGLSMDPPGIFDMVSWSNSSETLSLTVGARDYLRRGQACRITLYVHGEAALKLPVVGIRFDADIFQIALDSADGNVLPTKCRVAQSVGSLRPGRAEIRFHRYRAGLVTALSVSLTPLMPVSANEVISQIGRAHV